MMIILPNHVSDVIDARVDEFIAAYHPSDARESIRQSMIDAWATYGEVPEIKPIKSPEQDGEE